MANSNLLSSTAACAASSSQLTYARASGAGQRRASTKFVPPPVLSHTIAPNCPIPWVTRPAVRSQQRSTGTSHDDVAPAGPIDACHAEHGRNIGENNKGGMLRDGGAPHAITDHEESSWEAPLLLAEGQSPFRSRILCLALSPGCWQVSCGDQAGNVFVMHPVCLHGNGPVPPSPNPQQPQIKSSEERISAIDGNEALRGSGVGVLRLEAVAAAVAAHGGTAVGMLTLAPDFTMVTGGRDGMLARFRMPLLPAMDDAGSVSQGPEVKPCDVGVDQIECCTLHSAGSCENLELAGNLSDTTACSNTGRMDEVTPVKCEDVTRLEINAHSRLHDAAMAKGDDVLTPSAAEPCFQARGAHTDPSRSVITIDPESCSPQVGRSRRGRLEQLEGLGVEQMAGITVAEADVVLTGGDGLERLLCGFQVSIFPATKEGNGYGASRNYVDNKMPVDRNLHHL